MPAAAAPQRRRVGHVSLRQLDAARQQLAGLGRVPHQSDHLVAALGQLARDGVADLSGGAGDEGPHRQVTPLSWRRSVRAYRLPDPQDPDLSAAELVARLRPAPVEAGHRGLEGPPGRAAKARGHRRRRAPHARRGPRLCRGRDRGRHLLLPGLRRGHPHGVERRLTELVGPIGGSPPHRPLSQRPGGDGPCALPPRDGPGALASSSWRSWSACWSLARAHRDWRMPGYTHLQRAQPVYLGHHLLAYFWMLERDEIRFAAAAGSTMAMPLGSGALAGLNWDVDRQGTAAELGFARPSPNSIDAVSNRDFALDYLHAAAVCAMHLSRLGSEIVLWSSQEFGFCHPADDFASGSSIMPQKKNPDAAELLRAKAPRVDGVADDPPRRAARPPARLLQGPAGGQGGPLRRRRHDRAVARGGRAHARRAALRPRADGGRRRGRDGGGDRHRGSAGSQGHAVPGGTRGGRRARAHRRRVRAHALRADSRRARGRARTCWATTTTRRSATGRGSTRRSRPEGRPRRASTSSSRRRRRVVESLRSDGG